MANEKNERLGKVGGQAVVEGVMMKSGDIMAVASRMPDGRIKVTRKRFSSVRQKNKFLDLPLIRGVVNFVEMMKLSFTTMNISTEALGLEEEEPSKFEKWLAEKLKVNVMDFVMAVGIVLGLVLSCFLFIFLPSFTSSGISALVSWISGGKFVLSESNILFSVVEGLMKIAIFLAYLWLVSLMKEIKRVFQYHGAEHKSIFCYEKGMELTAENAAKCKRFHPRCGTSFMFLMILIGIIIGCFLPSGLFLRPLIKLLLLPLTMGLGYEFIRFAGKHDNWLVRAISAPGLWVQRLTTKEPDNSQLECAIAALKAAMPNEFPEEAVEDDEIEGAKEHTGGMRLVHANVRRIRSERAVHDRVVMRGLSKKERVRYKRKNRI